MLRVSGLFDVSWQPIVKLHMENCDVDATQPTISKPDDNRESFVNKIGSKERAEWLVSDSRRLPDAYLPRALILTRKVAGRRQHRARHAPEA